VEIGFNLRALVDLYLWTIKKYLYKIRTAPKKLDAIWGQFDTKSFYLIVVFTAAADRFDQYNPVALFLQQ
jgi:hypothetical protein